MIFLKYVAGVIAILLAMISIMGLLVVMALFHKIVTTPKEFIKEQLYGFSSKRLKRHISNE